MESLPGPEAVADQIRRRRAEALGTLELLAGYREQVAAERAALEHPQAVDDYLAFFIDFVSGVLTECDRIVGELALGAQTPQVAALRAIVARANAEQRRCLQFRDKCINRPLPHERLRPLLNEISVNTRDQLTAFRDLGTAADRIEALVPAAPPPKKGLDRRELFTRMFKNVREPR